MGANDRNGFPALIGALALLAALPSASTTTAPDAGTLARRVADAYGARAFGKVESVRYVFNVRVGGKDIRRAWTWFPKEDSVAFAGKDAGGAMLNASYSRRNKWSMGSEAVQGIDKMFVNDNYWLFFPLHLAWDSGLTLDSEALPPARPGEAYRLTVQYPKEGGYTPGDAYDLFVSEEGIIRRWIFRKSGQELPTREAAWSEPTRFGPIRLSLEHEGSGDFKLWFEGVKVETGK